MSTHEVTLVFEDGRIVKFPASETDNIYFAALKSKVRILTDCLEGACATCKGLCTRGDYYLDDYTKESLTQAEYDRREVLTCQMHVTSDCVIEFPYASKIALKSAPETHPATVAEIDMVSSTVAKLVLNPQADAPALSFMPGQYVHLSVPGTSDTRSYSFANPPTDSGQHVFYIKLLEQGAMSDYIRDRAAPGDEMDVIGPFGRFYLRPVDGPVLMIAGGTGLAPMLSILDTMVAQGDTAHPVHVLYGANEPEEFFALEALEAYRGRGLQIATELCAVQSGSGWDGAVGHVTSLLRSELLYGGDSRAYLCGPPPMIDAGENWLRGNGLGADRIHAEKFVAS